MVENSRKSSFPEKEKHFTMREAEITPETAEKGRDRLKNEGLWKVRLQIRGNRPTRLPTSMAKKWDNRGKICYTIKKKTKGE